MKRKRRGRKEKAIADHKGRWIVPWSEKKTNVGESVRMETEKAECKGREGVEDMKEEVVAIEGQVKPTPRSHRCIEVMRGGGA